LSRVRGRKVGKQAKGNNGEESDTFVKFIDECIFADCRLINMAIYAILEAPQELYFGSHSERNLNVLEKVVLQVEVGEGENRRYIDIEKPYYSPTKQRGIERRAIAYSLVKMKNGELKPYYKYFNLSIDVTNTYANGVPDPRDVLTYVWGATWTKPTMYLRGRVGYGGGVAIQPGPVLSKQRNRVDYKFYEQIEKLQSGESKKEGKESEDEESEKEEREVTAQMIWVKEYVEPHILIPVYRSYMLLGVENMEPHAVAYAFLRGLELAGAGTPKGINILESYWLERGKNEVKEKVIVVDIGVTLLPEPVVISPAIISVQEALDEFKKKACSISNNKILNYENNIDDVFENAVAKGYCRLLGNDAYEFLRDLAEKFSHDYLMNIENLQIPRVARIAKVVAEKKQEEKQG